MTFNTDDIVPFNNGESYTTKQEHAYLNLLTEAEKALEDIKNGRFISSNEFRKRLESTSMQSS